MTKDYPGENWKIVKFDFEFTNDMRMEVSNFGRVRSFNYVSDGNILNGSMINGYRILRMRLFKERDEKLQQEVDNMKLRISKLGKKIKAMKLDKEDKAVIAPIFEQQTALKKTLSNKLKVDEKNRRIYYHCLIHRLVAKYFLKPPTPDQTVVAHLDHDKLNNRSYNLKWMTAEENYAHQRNSPLVIKEKNDRRYKRKPSQTSKLSVTKVMLLKKLLNQNKPMKQLVKQFKVTDTQIIRIKKGINWSEIEAAP